MKPFKTMTRFFNFSFEAAIQSKIAMLGFTVLLGLATCNGPTDSANNDDYLSISETPFDSVGAGSFTWGNYNETKSIDYTFLIQRFEVTNGQYADFLNLMLENDQIDINDTSVTGSYEGDERWAAGEYEFLDLNADACRIYYSNSQFQVKSGFCNHPVVEETWFGAKALADYYLMRLPTNEEWEKAARSNNTYYFTWGNDLDGRRANYIDSGDPYDNGTTPVGFYNGEKHKGFQTTDSPGPYGSYDLVGNAWEWIEDYAGTSIYKPIRGGSWNNNSTFVRTTYYSLHMPTESTATFGFRLVKDL